MASPKAVPLCRELIDLLTEIVLAVLRLGFEKLFYESLGFKRHEQEAFLRDVFITSHQVMNVGASLHGALASPFMTTAKGI